MGMTTEEREELEARLDQLRSRLKELNDSVPAHSSTIHHMVQIEEIEDEMEELRSRLSRV
jgi:chromosome segregation ATPase